LIDGRTIVFHCWVKGTLVKRGIYPSDGIFASTDGILRAVAQDTPHSVPGGGTFHEFFSPAISGKNILFAATYEHNGKERNGIFLTDGNNLRLVVRDDRVIPGCQFNSFSAQSILGDTFAFNGQYERVDGQNKNYEWGRGVFLWRNGNISTVIRMGPSPIIGGKAFDLFGIPVLGRSFVAFQAEYSDKPGGERGSGVFISDGSSMKAIATTDGIASNVPGGGKFTQFDLYAVAASGDTVAFGAIYTTGGSDKSGQRGIFVFRKGTLQAIVRNDDPIFGSEISTLGVNNGGLDGDHLVFYYSLRSRKSGVALASLPRS